MQPFKGKVAVVTGGASGLGLNFAKVYAQSGAQVVLLDILEDRLEEAAGTVAAYGTEVLPLCCDVTDEVQVKGAVEAALRTFGQVDILCNNAGISISEGIHSISYEKWRRVIDVNLNGVFLMSHYLLPHMMERGYGKIVNISSINAVLVAKDHAAARHAYNTTKLGLVGMTRAMAASYGKFGITVNAIGPCLFRTEMSAFLYDDEAFITKAAGRSPMNRTGRDHEMDALLRYLSSDDSSYVTGQFIVADGGYGLV